MGNTPGRHDIPVVDWLEPGRWRKRPRSLLTDSDDDDDEEEVAVDLVPPPRCRLLELPTDMLREICAYVGSPWCIASACTVTRRIWKTVGMTVVVNSTTEMAAITRAFPDAGKVVLILREGKICSPVPPPRSLPAFPRATTLAIHLGRHIAFTRPEYRAFGPLVSSTVNCAKITKCKLKVYRTGFEATEWLEAMPAMPALVRLHIHTMDRPGPIFRVITQSFQNVPDLRISGQPLDDLDIAYMSVYSGTANATRLHIYTCASQYALEHLASTIKDVYPRLHSLVVRLDPDDWAKLACRGSEEEKAVDSLVRRFPFVRIEWPLGANLPATACLPPGARICAEELRRAFRAMDSGYIPTTFQDVLSRIRPNEPHLPADELHTLLNRDALFVYLERVSYKGGTLNASIYADVAMEYFLSGPATAKHNARIHARRNAQRFCALRVHVDPYTDRHESFQHLLREIVRTTVHSDAFCEEAFVVSEPWRFKPNWIQELSCNK